MRRADRHGRRRCGTARVHDPGAPAGERACWQGLAQVCVGVTHLQRGNLVGAARLLRRGAATAPVDVAAQALALAEQVEGGRTVAPVLSLPAAIRP